MYSFNNDPKDNVDADNNSQIRQTNTPPTSNLSQSSSPSCTTLLVIDDTSNSEDSITINTNNIPVKPMPSTTAQISHIQTPTTLSPSTHLDIANGSVEQHRRRTSSIAKLLGGHPLNNQQYEEINQQILDDQSAQSVTNNNDNGIDSGIQRSRSSITRTLLMNSERTNSITKLPPKLQTVSSPSFGKDFEYLIRREVDKLDNEHAPSTIPRHNSASKVVQNLNSSNNINTQLKLKRKRPIAKSPLTTSDIPPFALHDPFQLDSSATNPNPNPNPNPSINHSQDKFHHIDPSKRPRFSNPQPQQYNLPTNQSSSYPYHNVNMNSSNYNQFNIPQERISSNNYSHYPPPTKVPLSTPVTYLSSSSTISHNNNSAVMTSARKTKVNISKDTTNNKSMLIQPELHEPSRRRSYSNASNPSDSSLETSSKTTVPLKKRLLDAYNNEQHPASSL